MRNNEVTEKLRKPNKFPNNKRIFLIAGIIVVLIVGLIILNFSKTPPYISVPFLNNSGEGS